MAGKARSIAARGEKQPDTRFYEFINNISQPLINDINNTLETKAPNNRYMKLRGGVMQGIVGQVGKALTISSGILYLWKDGTDDIIPRSLINIGSEGGSADDTLDLIDMNDMEIPGAKITLWGFISGPIITLTHNATASGTGKGIFCPGDVDYTLKNDEFVDLVWTGSVWHVQQSSVYGSLEVRTTENTEADISLYRNDSSVSIGNACGNVYFYGNSSNGTKRQYGLISATVQTTTNGSEDTQLEFYVRDGGSDVKALDIDGKNTNFGILDGWDIQVATSTGTKIGTASTQKLGFWGVTPVVQRSAYTVTNHITDRSYDANATSVAELADVLGTLLVDLRSIGIVQ